MARPHTRHLILAQPKSPSVNSATRVVIIPGLVPSVKIVALKVIRLAITGAALNIRGNLKEVVNIPRMRPILSKFVK